MKGLEELGRVRLSETFFLRDFLHSEIAAFYGLATSQTIPTLRLPPAEGSAKTCWSRCRPPSGGSPFAPPIARRRSTPSATNTASTAPPTKPMPPATSGTCGTPRAAWGPRPAWSCPGWRIVFARRATGAGSPGGSTITCPMQPRSLPETLGRQHPVARAPEAHHFELRRPARHPDATGNGQPRGQPCGGL